MAARAATRGGLAPAAAERRTARGRRCVRAAGDHARTRRPGRRCWSRATTCPAAACVGPADVAVREVPAAALPEGALRAEPDLDGRTLAAPVRAGEMHHRRAAGRPVAAGPRTATRWSPLRCGSPTPARCALLRPGDVVDVLAADGSATDRPLCRAGPIGGFGRRGADGARRATRRARRRRPDRWRAGDARHYRRHRGPSRRAAVSERLSIVLRGS